MFKGVLLVSLALLCLASCDLLDKKADRKKEKLSKDDLQVSKNTKRETLCQPTCANPRGFDGCNCRNSKCMLEGCVNYDAFGAVWKPNNCTTCHCNSNKKMCFTETCKTLDCFGYPTIKKPGKCCEECDFGVAHNECSLIPVGMRSISLGEGQTSTTCKQVQVYGCNTNTLWDNRWYRCVERSGMSSISTNEGCEDVTGKYQDVMSCDRQEIPDDELPLDTDYLDFSSCAVYFH